MDRIVFVLAVVQPFCVSIEFTDIKPIIADNGIFILGLCEDNITRRLIKIDILTIKVSVKTRMGVDSTEEFPEILEIYNKYPLSKLIVHARDKVGKYQSKPDIDMFISAFPNSSNPTAYNGDIFSPLQLESLKSSGITQ